MPRALARIRKRYIEGHSDVPDWEIEETLVYGVPTIFGPPCPFKTRDEWQHAWGRYREIILPKVIEHRPGTRPIAMYATGEIPPREIAIQLPRDHGWWSVDVRDRDGSITTHYLNVPPPFMRPQVQHLRALGIVDGEEYRRHREWMKRPNPDCDRCATDTYPLEMSLYE
jgi:hypothetical protein